MSVYVLVAADFVKTGGMDRANYALADYLARRGDEVYLVAHAVGGALLRHPNLHWRRVSRPLRSDALAWPLLDRAGRRCLRRLRRPDARMVVNGGNCPSSDINWMHYVHAAYAAPIAAGPASRVWNACKRTRARADERRALPQARFVIANSERTRRDLISCLGLAPERIHRVYYGCDAELFSPISAAERRLARASLGLSESDRVAIFIGALGDRRKGFDTLFAAWQRLAGTPLADARLLVVGRGRELPAWRARIRAAGLETAIRLLGFRADVPHLLAACDVLIAPVRYEAFGLAVQEALARGLPAIVSADAGVAERISPALSHLCLRDCESVDELTARLLQWSAGAAAWSAEAERVGAGLRAWSWDQMAERILAVVEPVFTAHV